MPDTKREVAWAGLGSIAFAVVFGFPILRHITAGNVPQHIGRIDWDYHLQLHWVPVETIIRFHQFPFWNPYKCGGMPMFGNPQAALFTPFLALELLLGAVIGLRLGAVIHIAILFGGTYYLARALRLSILGAIACACAFAGSSWYYLHLEMGHTEFSAFAYAPWAIALLFLGSERRRLMPGAAGGLLMALILMEGGVYPFLFTAATLAAIAAMIAAERRSFFPLLLLGIMGAFTAGAGAVKLIPGFAFSGVYARLIPPNEIVHLPRFLAIALFKRDQYPELKLTGMDSAFYNYGAYIGAIFAGLALVGAVCRFRAARIWLGLAIVALALGAGGYAPHAPWVILHRLPFFASARQPERWLIIFTLTAAVLAGLGADAISAQGGPWGPRIAAALIAIAVLDGWSVSTRYLHNVDEGTDPAPPASTGFRQWRRPGYYGPYHWMLTAAENNTGVLTCYDNIPPPVSDSLRGYDEPGYRGEQYMLGPGAVKLVRWTPNELTFDVDAPRATVMAINQNYDRNWRVVEGRGEVVSEAGLLAAVLQSGKQRIKIAYQSREFAIGLGITLATWGAIMGLWLYERRRGSGLP